MKKLILVFIIISCLFIPIKSTYYDGGTKVYNALLYKIIVWHKLSDNYDGGYKDGKEVYYFPNNFHSVEYYDDIIPDDLYISYKDTKLKMNIGAYSWSKKVDGQMLYAEAIGVSPINQQYKNSVEIKNNSELIITNDSKLNITSVKLYKIVNTRWYDPMKEEEYIELNIKDNKIYLNQELGDYILVLKVFNSNEKTAIYSASLLITEED